MQRTTSQNISIKFTIFTIVLIFLFGLIINILHFTRRHRQEQRKLHTPWSHQQQEKVIKKKNTLLPYNDRIRTVTATTDRIQQLKAQTIWRNIIYTDNEYFIYKVVNNTIRFTTITRFIETQYNLLILFVWLMVIFGIIAYISSLFFVKSSLKSIQQLVDYIEQLDITTINKPVPISGPKHDEIHRIGHTLQQTLSLITQQTTSLKHFIAHASHELKTPLMWLSATLDSALNTWTLDQHIPSLKQSIKQMNKLFETLLDFTKREHQQLKKSNHNIVAIINHCSNQLESIYQHKKITLKFSWLTQLPLSCHHEATHIIVKNIIENAYKYTPEQWEITITINKTSIIISDTGQWIDKKWMTHMRDPFWKKTTQYNSQQASYWLGLSLVQTLIKKQWRTIDATSTVWQGTTFTISFA